MHAWLQSLTRPEDPVVWAWVALVVGYALVGVVLGRRARPRAAPLGQPDASPQPVDSSSR